MTPPISIDGTDITGATIDGQDVQQITVDGQTVFSATLSFTEDFESGNVNDWQDVFSGSISITSSSDVISGSFSGEVSGVNDGTNVSNGVIYTPSITSGQINTITATVDFRELVGDNIQKLHFYESANPDSSYRCEYFSDFGGFLRIRKVVNGNDTVLSSDSSGFSSRIGLISTATFTYDFQTNDLTSTLFDAQNNQIANVSANDSDVSPDCVGVGTFRGNAIADNLSISIS